MPRKSAAELAFVTPATTAARPRLTPPASLSTAERLEFIAISEENSHLRRTDAPMLACYITAVTRVQKLARSKDVAAWERATKTMLALARSLRLTQQACTDPKTLSRARNKPDAAAIMAQMTAEAFDNAEDALGDDPNGYAQFRAERDALDALNARVMGVDDDDDA